MTVVLPDDEIVADADASPAPAIAGDPAIDTEPAPSHAAPLPLVRVGAVIGCSVVGAGVMCGGLFEGAQGRAAPAVAGLAGIGVAAAASRRRSPLGSNVVMVLGILGIGVALLLPDDPGAVFRLSSTISEISKASKVLRPPVELLPGWRLMIGWALGSVGFLAGWCAFELRRPSLGLLVPIPVVGFAAISVPEDAKLPLGVAAAVLFITGLALLPAAQTLVDGGDGAVDIGYDIRRAVRSLPALVVVVAVLVGLARADVLFPKPRFDPSQAARAPKAVPLSKVRDRVLFSVTSASNGPWRIGMLDVYAADEWRLPPFAESQLAPVPASGVVDSELEPGVKADFTIGDLGGAVLPGMPNPTGVIAEGPRLSFDPRVGAIRLAQGQIKAGLRYTVVAAALPTEDDLRAARGGPPPDVARSLAMPAPPPAVARLLDEAPKEPLWDRLDFVRRRLLETVVAVGAGSPAPVPPSRVADMLEGSKEGSPFEIVAAQAMLARWAGVPARIAYGYDGGEVIDGGDHRDVRPRHGASWLEVWFPKHRWVPVIGAPLRAKSALNSEGPAAPTTAQASDEIAVQVYFPIRTRAGGQLYRTVQRVLLYVVPIALAVALAYVSWPVGWKRWRRARARAAAAAAGPRGQVAQAYAELRDLCTDLGIGRWSDAPLAFLRALVDDEEHTELAWLTTRTIWGDLRHAVTEEHAADAVELSRTLRRRIAQAQPLTIRLIAEASRLSVRHPWAPELATAHREEDADVVAA